MLVFSHGIFHRGLWIYLIFVIRVAFLYEKPFLSLYTLKNKNFWISPFLRSVLENNQFVKNQIWESLGVEVLLLFF